MIDTLVASERQKYAAVWADPSYRVRAHGLDLWTRCRGYFPEAVGAALDIGCGHGRLVAAWLREGIDAAGVDISETAPDPDIFHGNEGRFRFAPLWSMDLGRRFGIGVCADVMEHIPGRMVGMSLARIASHCDLVVFKIAGFPSLHLGHTLHLTVQPAAWWQGCLAEHFGSVEQLAYPTDRPEWVFRCAGGRR